MLVKQCSIHGSRANYYGRKKQINYKFIPTSLFRGRPLIRGFTYIYSNFRFRYTTGMIKIDQSVKTQLHRLSTGVDASTHGLLTTV